MQWVIQNNLFNERGITDLLSVLEYQRRNVTLVEVIPFSHELVPVPEVQNPIVVMGSTTLVKIAQTYGWAPGVWFNDNFRFEAWFRHYGQDLLNADSVVCRFEDVAFEGSVFIRPCEDLKQFAGSIVDDDEFSKWREKVLAYGDTLNADTMVTYAPVKTIYSEYRFFVVKGEVVTGSRYKLGNRVLPSPDVDPEVLVYVKRMVQQWQPDEAFVIDIAMTDAGPKVIEINNLNSSGFYAIDVGTLISSIERVYA